MRRIAVFSTAGGTGKTTTVVNLAAALCERGHRVLVVDFAPGARLERALGQPRRQDLIDAIDAERPLDAFVRPTPFAGLFLLGASLSIDAEERLRRKHRSFEEHLRRAFGALFDEPYGFVLFDCGTAVQRFVTLALSLCDEHIAPIEATPLSISALGDTLGFAEAVRAARNPRLRASRILVSRWQEQSAASRAVASLRERFPGSPFESAVPCSNALVEASAACEPIVTYASEDPASTAFRSLAGEILAAPETSRPTWGTAVG